MLTWHLQPARRPAPRAPRRGLSILELLVGAAVGMVVIGGAATLFAKNLAGSRLLLAESRLNEDLRNAADLVTRDLRRAGYWGNAIKGTQAIGVGAATTPNPYSQVTAPSAEEVAYRFSRESGTDNDTLDGNEQFGFRLQDDAVQMQAGSGWTDITDKTAVRIKRLEVTPTETSISLGDTCPTVCGVGTPNCPTAKVRNYSVLLHGESVRDPSIQRSLRSTVRVRNDQVSGSCPA
jgi:prepilin peptidase dependent protein B